MTDLVNVARLADRREEPKPTRHRAERVRLTTQRVKKAQPANKRVRIADDEVVGLHLVVQPSGAKSYVARGRVGGGRSRPMIDLTIGQHPVTSLSEARKRAKEILAQMRAGIDPRQKKVEEESVGGLLCAYLQHQNDRGVKRIDNIERSLKRATNGLLQEPFDAVPLRIWASAVARSRRDHGVSVAIEDRKWIIAMARWALSQEKATRADVLRLEAPKLSNAEKAAKADSKADRWTLRRADWAAFWDATDTARSPHFRDFLRCLALSGLRRREASLTQWNHIDLDAGTWTIPAAHAKTGQPHTVYIGPLMHAVLANTPKIAGTDLVFPGRGGVVISGWSKLVSTISEAFGAKVQMHGLRRGYRTALTELRVDRVIAEAMIAHARPDLERRYDLAELKDLRREAQEAFEAAWAEVLS